jgi:2-polyprenyl-3-methyl-5-hydroxy-6-metoxy-1,4-benzoquinol methylase
MSRSRDTISKFYDLLSKNYDTATQGAFKWTPPVEALNLVRPHLTKRSKILDVGVGTGQVSGPLAKEGHEVHGVDISEEMLKATKSKFPEMTVHSMDLADGLSGLSEKEFDLVLAIGMLEFVSDFKNAIETCSRLLKPGGIFCFTYEEHLKDHELQSEAFSETWKGTGAQKSDVLDFMHYRHTPESVKSIVEGNNLELVTSKQFQAYLKSQKMIPIFYQNCLCMKR